MLTESESTSDFVKLTPPSDSTAVLTSPPERKCFRFPEETSALGVSFAPSNVFNSPTAVAVALLGEESEIRSENAFLAGQITHLALSAIFSLSIDSTIVDEVCSCVGVLSIVCC